MKKLTVVIVVLAAASLFVAACSSGTNTAGTANTGQPKAGNAPANVAPPKTDENIPAPVKAAIPDAQSFTTQHKDIPKEQITEIENTTGGKVPATDHHSYVAFSTTGGARRQVGAVTIVKAAGKDIVIIYESKDGSPSIKEVRADGIAPEFLKQFAGKGHDDDLTSTKSAGGVDDATAKAVARAIHIDMLTMQSLYGAAHKH